MNSPSWSSVGLRKTGAVSRMKSFQNCPGSSSVSGAGPSRISRSSNPCASRLPANDSSITNTTRCPRSRSTCPMPTQLFVGPYAPSGKNTIVAACCSMVPLARSRSLAGVANLREPSATFNTDLLVGARWFAGKGRTVAEVRADARLEPAGADGAAVELVDVAYADGGTERYALALRDGRECAGDDPLWPALARESGVDVRGSGRFLAEDLSNTVVLLDEAHVLKLYRRPEPGTHPEVGAPRRARGLAACAHPGRTPRARRRHARLRPGVRARRAGGLGAAHRLARRRRSGARPADAARARHGAAASHPRRAPRHDRGRAPAGARRPPRRPVPPLRRDARRGRLGGPAEPDARGATPPATRPPGPRLAPALARARRPGRAPPERRLRLARLVGRRTRRGARRVRRRRPRAPPRPRGRGGAGRARVRETAGSPSGSTCRRTCSRSSSRSDREARRLPPRHPRGARAARGLPRRLRRRRRRSTILPAHAGSC